MVSAQVSSIHISLPVAQFSGISGWFWKIRQLDSVTP